MSVQSAKVPVVSLSAEPKLIQQNLYFRQNIPKGGENSQQEFQVFVDNFITPRFPAGLTIFDANRQFFNHTSTPSKENTKVVSVFVEDTLQSKAATNEIIKAYKQQFKGADVK